MIMDYTIESCYYKYKGKCEEVNIIFVLCDKFRRSFREEFSISFKIPKSDTSSECDSINIVIQEAKNKNNLELLNQLKQRQDFHHRKAQTGEDVIKTSTALGKDLETYVITFDLQQALPMPKLSTGPTFYKKKLFCYNFSIHSCSENQGYFYTWDESTAGRGADEIASCVLKHFSMKNIRASKLIAVSDNCCGQNKN